MNLQQSAKITATVLSVVAGSLLFSAAGPMAAGEIKVATSKKTTTYSPALIDQARMANQARAGNDDEWDECMKKAKGDFVEKLAACFCLTTPNAPCGGDGSFD